VDGLVVQPLLTEPFVAVLPRRHPLARAPRLSVTRLRDEPFVLFSPAHGRRAYEKTLAVCEAHGFRPRIVQEAPQWLTILRLVGAGLGVTIAPACVERIAGPEAVCRGLRGTTTRSDVELAYREGETRAIVTTFCRLVRNDLAPHARRAPGR
jgi:DNA-binding transcriptional LysR family regulator